MKMNLGGELVGMVRSVLDESRAATLPPVSGARTRAKGSVRKARVIAPLNEKEHVFLQRLESGQVLSIETVATGILGRGRDNVGIL